MKKLASLLFFCITLTAFAQTIPTPYFPNGTASTVRPVLTINIPSCQNFRYFSYQVDTAPDFSSPIVFQSPWVVSGAYQLNYDSMIFNQTYYWRVKSVKVTGTLYDTTAWSSSLTFI